MDMINYQILMKKNACKDGVDAFIDKFGNKDVSINLVWATLNSAPADAKVDSFKRWLRLNSYPEPEPQIRPGDIITLRDSMTGKKTLYMYSIDFYTRVPVSPAFPKDKGYEVARDVQVRLVEIDQCSNSVGQVSPYSWSIPEGARFYTISELADKIELVSLGYIVMSKDEQYKTDVRLKPFN